MGTTKAAAMALMFSLVLNAALPAESVLSDTAQLGLRGPVRMLFERRGQHRNSDGSWNRNYLPSVRKIEFNKAGFKTVEYTYGHTTQRTNYMYDQAGELVEKEEFTDSRRTSTWQRTAIAGGSRTEWVSFNNQGEIYNRIVVEFDGAGKKTFEITYDAKGDVTRRWQHLKSGEGAVTTLSMTWGQAERTDYDAQGRITAMRRGSGRNLLKWSYLYDAQGRLAQACYTDNDDQKSSFVYTFTYDTAGNLVETVHRQSPETPVGRRRYSYSAAGRLDTETVEWFDPDGTLDHTITIRYSHVGRVIEKELKHAKEPYSCRWTYSYDTYGHLAEESFYDSFDRIVTRSETTWDSEGRKLSEINSGRLVDPGFKVLYEYDEVGRLLETVRFDLEGRQLSRESRRYSRWGDLQESASYNPDGSLITSTHYDYVYDEWGNWIERITMVTDNAAESYDQSTELRLRQIEYYP